jgi:branched-chain amino acid transport system ATP-binding protein
MAIMGLVTAAGTRDLRQVAITGGRPRRIVRSGLTLVPEGASRIYQSFGIRRDLRLGAVGAADRGALPEDELMTLFPVLADRRGQLAGTLSGGEQQQLAIARALRSSPRLLLLDEPSLGLGPQVVEAIFDLLAKLRARGTTILVVEQNVNLALEIADRAYVLASGALRLSGTSKQLLASSDVDRAYLGIGAS